MCDEFVNTAKNGLDAVKAIIQKISDQLPGVIQEIHDKVVETGKQLRVVVDKFVAKGKECAEKIKKCVTDEQGELTHLQEEALEGFEKCTAVIKHDADLCIRDIRNAVEGFKSKMSNLLADIKCGISCILKIGTDVFDIYTFYNNNKALIEGDVADIVNEWKVNTDKCLATLRGQLLAEEEEIGQKIETCINQQLGYNNMLALN